MTEPKRYTVNEMMIDMKGDEVIYVADDPAIVEWKRKAEALAKIVKEWNGSPKPCQQEARRLIPEVLDAIESATKQTEVKNG